MVHRLRDAMKNEAGKMVAKATGITVVRNPDAGKK